MATDKRRQDHRQTGFRAKGLRALFQTTIEKSEATLVAAGTFYRPPLNKKQIEWLQTEEQNNENHNDGCRQTKKNNNKGYRQMIRITTTNNGYRQTKEWTNTTTATLVTDRRTKTTAATNPQR